MRDHRRCDVDARRVVASPQHFPGLFRRPHDSRFGQFGQRIRQPFRIGTFVVIGRALETEWVLDALLWFVGANHPRSGPLIVFIVRRLARTGPPGHLRDARAARCARTVLRLTLPGRDRR